MLYFLLYSVLFAITAVLQTVLAPHIEILGAQPSFLLILIIIIALKHGALAGCFIGFMTGLCYDVYAPVEWFGAYSFSYCVIGFTAGQVGENFIKLNLAPKIIVLAVAELLKDILYFICISKNHSDILHYFIAFSFPNSIYTISLGAILFCLITPRREKKIIEI